MSKSVTLQGESLNSLFVEYGSRFYAQTWYQREPFACQTHRGTFLLDGQSLPAAVLVKAYCEGLLPQLHDHFMWSSDVDHHGDRVYVGMANEYPGLQIHRHLEIDDRWLP